MAKRTDLKKIMIIGSGPIVIGQAAEFDYAGTQACLALKEDSNNREERVFQAVNDNGSGFLIALTAG